MIFFLGRITGLYKNIVRRNDLHFKKLRPDSSILLIFICFLKHQTTMDDDDNPFSDFEGYFGNER